MSDGLGTQAARSMYPLGRRDDDPRFTLGLAVDVRDVLLGHGFPELDGADLVRLQRHLFAFLYEEDVVDV